MDNRNTPLAQPIKIGTRTVPNRFVINAMECCDATEDGSLSDVTLERYKKLCEGGAGVIIFESFTIQYESIARISQLSLLPQNMDILKKAIRQLKEINNEVLLIFQLNHSGEVSDGEFSQPVCVKPRYGFGGELVDEEYIDKTMEDFVNASKILHDIGADGVDLKLCHGYLGCQILRPYNDRNWKYGGSFENRSRFAYDLTEMVRRAVNDDNFVVGTKLSMYEGFPGGFGSAGPDTPVMDLTEPIELCKGLEERGMNFILESLGASKTNRAIQKPPKYKPDEAFWHFYMTKILKENLKPETTVMGSAYSVFNRGKNILQGMPEEEKSLFYFANQNIEKGYTDMIAIGRQSLADPYLPVKYLENREDEIKWCVACDLCTELLRRQCHVGCVVHNKPYTEILKAVRAEKGKYNMGATP